MNTSWRNISSLWDCPVRDNILGKGKNIFHKSRRDDMSIYQAEVYSLSFVYHNEEVISTFSYGNTMLEKRIIFFNKKLMMFTMKCLYLQKVHRYLFRSFFSRLID